jgi:hypothetical protein
LEIPHHISAFACAKNNHPKICTLRGREKGTFESRVEVLGKYPEVVRYLKLNKALRDVASRSKVQKVKRLISQPDWA